MKRGHGSNCFMDAEFPVEGDTDALEQDRGESVQYR